MNTSHGVYQELVDEKREHLFSKVKGKLGEKPLELVKLAFQVSDHAHFDQKRKSGEPYVTHPLEVATIICDWGLDEQTIAGALLHDVIEDTEVGKSDLEQIFGSGVADLVDGVTKLEKIHFESEEAAHAEYFQKVVLAMSKDIRVILIKLADRLHNMLTLGNMSIEKRKSIALETMEIYVPIANKIGLHRVHLQLADECFRHLHRFRYLVLTKAVEDAQKKRLPIIEEILKNISNSLKSNGISAHFIYRQRTIYNLYQRMVRRSQSFERIHDIFEIKVVVDIIGDCYLTLGVLHSLYQPLPGKFKDYIAIPKSNGYQSLHSTLLGPHGTPIQLHIRTAAMDDVAENGIISYWSKHQYDEKFLSASQGTTSWINNILDIQSSSFSAHEFLTTLKQDLSPGDIYTFTPKGKIILLPKGSTVLDFAYYIHTNIGNHCLEAKVNQKKVSLGTKLQNGDIVEITTSNEVEPNDNWLQSVVSGKAISKIKHYLKEQKYEEDLSNGITLINKCFKMLGGRKNVKINDSTLETLVAQHYPRLTPSELIHSAGNGNISILQIVKHLLNLETTEPLPIQLSKSSFPVIQDNQCRPLPGETMLGQITRHGELVLHKQNCKQSRLIGLDNLTLVHIINDARKQFAVRLVAYLYNEPGTFRKFAAKISQHKINILELNQDYQSDEVAIITVTLSVRNLVQIETLIDMLKSTAFIQKVNIS